MSPFRGSTRSAGRSPRRASPSPYRRGVDEIQGFRVSDGLASGLTRSQMRGSRFVAPHRGIRMLTRPSDAAQLAIAFAARLPPRAFLCGPTAAMLWRLPMPRGWKPGDLYVAVPTGTRRVDAAGVIAHHLTVRDSDVVWHRGVRITSPERTWCDLGSAVPLPSLVAIADRLLWHRDPLSTRLRLDEAIRSLRSTRGVRSLRLARELASDRADSPPESEIRVALHLAAVPPPQVNVDVIEKGGLSHEPT